MKEVPHSSSFTLVLISSRYGSLRLMGPNSKLCCRSNRTLWKAPLPGLRLIHLTDAEFNAPLPRTFRRAGDDSKTSHCRTGMVPIPCASKAPGSNRAAAWITSKRVLRRPEVRDRDPLWPEGSGGLTGGVLWEVPRCRASRTTRLSSANKSN